MTKKKIKNTNNAVKAHRPGRKIGETADATFESDENTLLLYMHEISKIPLMKKEEEEKTAKLAAMGNEAAIEKLIKSNLRFVIMIAKKYQGKGLPLEDLIGEGNVGLLNGVKHFDVSKGYRFITYAVWWIRQAIIKAIHEKSRMIRLPCNKSNTLIQIEKTRMAIQNEPGGKPNMELREAAKYLDISPEKAEKLLNISQDVVSLDDPIINFEGTLAVKDFIEDTFYQSPVDNAINSVLKDDVERALGNLEERTAEIIRSRYGLGDIGTFTLKEVGDRYNLSRERVRQIENRALGNLKNSLLGGRLESYIA